MDKVSGPLGPRRKIGAALRQLRAESGKTLTEVADELMISSSKLSRLETAQGRPRMRDIRDLVEFYGKEGSPIASRLYNWTTAAQVRGWWTDFGDDLLQGPQGLDRHLAYEADATVERVYTLPFVPVLLQLPEYAEAVFRDMEGRSPGQVRDLIAIRKERQNALRSRIDMDPLELVAVTYESTLRQVVGSSAILGRQIDELVRRSYDNNVTIRVLPFSARPVRTMTCMYAYFEYRGTENLEQDVVHIETQEGFWTIDDPKRVAEYRQWHDDLLAASLGEEDSRKFMKSIRDNLGHEP